MASASKAGFRSATHRWSPAERVGDRMLRLRDGSLRAVIDCGPAVVTLGEVIEVLGSLPHPTQAVVRTSPASIRDDMPACARLRASQAMLIARSHGSEAALLRRLVVSVPWNADEGGDGPSLLARRVDDARTRLDRAGVEPAWMAGPELDVASAVVIVHEGRCEVRTDGLYARTLIITGRLARLEIDSLTGLDVRHDVSVHLRPARRSGEVEMRAYATIWTDTRDALDMATERAEALLTANGIRTRRPYLQAAPALVAALPICQDFVGARRDVVVKQVSASAEPPGGRYQLLSGVDPGTGLPIMLDRFRQANTGVVVLGSPPDRRRLLTLDLIRSRLAGIDVHLVGSGRAYEPALTALDATSVAPVAFGPFKTTAGQAGDLESRIQIACAAIHLAAGGTVVACANLVGGVEFAFAARGHAHDTKNSNLDPPTLEDIASAVVRRSPESHGLAERLRRYIDGAGSRLLEPELHQFRPRRLTVHNMDRLPAEDRPLAAFLSIDRLWRETPAHRHQLLMLDDAEHLLNDKPGQFLAALLMTAASRGVCVTVATHDVAGILRGNLRTATVGAGLVVLLRQTEEAIELLAEAFRLTPAEQSWLLKASADEGLLITRERRLAFQAVASDEEERLLTGGKA